VERDRQRVYNARYNAKMKKKKAQRKYYMNNREKQLEKSRLYHAKQKMLRETGFKVLENKPVQQVQLPIIEAPKE